MKQIYSLSGIPMELTDSDRALIAIAETVARPLMSNGDGQKVIGTENASLIVSALREHGLKITR